MDLMLIIPVMNSRNKFKLFIFAIMLPVFVSCEKEEVEVSREKVLLVYMGTDNNLSPETYEQIKALRKGWDALRSGVLYIYADPADDRPFLLKIGQEEGVDVQKVIYEYKESNSADKDILASVIDDVKALHTPGTVESYGLLVFSHASGWLPLKALTETEARSIIIDQEQEMELVDFANALPDHFFDFIIFDACFTAGIELVYELRNKANFIVGSSAEILTPGYTPYYPEVLNYLFQPRLDLVSFIQTIFDGINAQSGDDRSATFSIIKTSELKPLRDFVHSHCDFTKKTDISTIQDFGRYQFRSLFFDFGAYYASLLNTKDEVAMLSGLIGNCLIYRKKTPYFLFGDDGFMINQHSGMTTYIEQQRYPQLNKAWSKLAWRK